MNINRNDEKTIQNFIDYQAARERWRKYFREEIFLCF